MRGQKHSKTTKDVNRTGPGYKKQYHTQTGTANKNAFPFTRQGFLFIFRLAKLKNAIIILHSHTFKLQWYARLWEQWGKLLCYNCTGLCDFCPDAGRHGPCLRNRIRRPALVVKLSGSEGDARWRAEQNCSRHRFHQPPIAVDLICIKLYSPA